MSIPDSLILRYFEYLTDVSAAQVAEAKALLEKSQTNPRDVKAQLAREIVSRFYNPETAKKASEQFDTVFKRKELPDDIEDIAIAKDKLKDGKTKAGAVASGKCGSAKPQSDNLGCRRRVFVSLRGSPRGPAGSRLHRQLPAQRLLNRRKG